MTVKLPDNNRVVAQNQKKVDIVSYLAPMSDMALLDDIYSGGAPSPKIQRQPSPAKQSVVLSQTGQAENENADTEMAEKGSQKNPAQQVE